MAVLLDRLIAPFSLSFGIPSSCVCSVSSFQIPWPLLLYSLRCQFSGLVRSFGLRLTGNIYIARDTRNFRILGIPTKLGTWLLTSGATVLIQL